MKDIVDLGKIQERNKQEDIKESIRYHSAVVAIHTISFLVVTWVSSDYFKEIVINLLRSCFN